MKNVLDAIMPIAVGIWIGMRLSYWPRIAMYVNIIVMIIIFICAIILFLRFSKEKQKKSNQT